MVSHLVRHIRVLEQYSRTPTEKMCISSVTEAELLYGIAKSKTTHYKKPYWNFLKPLRFATGTVTPQQRTVNSAQQWRREEK
jgi:predicted nucleic acid-binding protein